MKENLLILAALLGIGILVLRDLVTRQFRRKRARFIAAYRFPDLLVRRYAEDHPTLDAAQVRKVFEGLRQYFLACLCAQRESIARSVGMPSRAVDDAWHDFILMTREYQAFCAQAFGSYLHHTPEGLMGVSMRDALANTLHQFRRPPPGVAPWAPAGTVPLLFAMDRELGVPDGFQHDAESLVTLEWARQQLARERGTRTKAAFTLGAYGGGGGSCGGGCSASCGGGGCGGGGCG